MAKNNLQIETLDFESALSNLENIVEKLGSGKVNLEEMVDLYEQGVALKGHCSKKLEDAKMKVDNVLAEKS
jgi:exodeoxyribonuclease VII small subunit